jgi:hypothetical protein
MKTGGPGGYSEGPNRRRWCSRVGALARPDRLTER